MPGMRLIYLYIHCQYTSGPTSSTGPSVIGQANKHLIYDYDLATPYVMAITAFAALLPRPKGFSLVSARPYGRV